MTSPAECGPLLMRCLMDPLRVPRIVEIFGHVLRENSAGMAVRRSLWLEEHVDADDPAIELSELAP